MNTYNKFLSLLVLTLLSVSCSTIYYKSWELLGQEKRDLLKSNLESLQDDQEEAKEEYIDVLSRIQKSYNYKTSKIDEVYDDMKDDYDELEEETQDISKRIEKIDRIAKDLFEEWKEEAQAFKNNAYKRKSLAKLTVTRSNLKKSLVSSRKSEKEMKFFLDKFKEQVTFVKHNLNAKAAGTLDKELIKTKTQMKSVIESLKRSIQSSKQIIKDLK